MSFADDATVLPNSPILQYLAIPLPDSATARENALGAALTLVDGWRYGAASEESGLSLWHEQHEFLFCTSILGIIGEVVMKAAIIWDEKAQGVNGGTFTAGAWRQRDLNVKLDPDNLVSVATNSVTILQSGRYWIRASAPTYGSGRNQARLTIGNVPIAQGTSEYSLTSAATNKSFVSFVATLSVGDVIRLEHQCSSTSSTYGFGVGDSSDFGVEIFSIMEIIKLD